MSITKSGRQDHWASAAKKLLFMSNQFVPCPECGATGLQVHDKEYGSAPYKGLSRYLICLHCGSYDAITLRRAGSRISIAVK